VPLQETTDSNGGEYTVPVSQNYTRQAQLRLEALGKEQPDVFFLLVVGKLITTHPTHTKTNLPTHRPAE